MLENEQTTHLFDELFHFWKVGGHYFTLAYVSSGMWSRVGPNLYLFFFVWIFDLDG
jgi:hypothetical protein